MAQEIKSGTKQYDPEGSGGFHTFPTLTIDPDHAALAKLVDGHGHKTGTEDNPLPVTSYTIEQLLLDNNRMLARWLQANDLIDHDDFLGYLE